jgi:hypothetical protein
MGSGVVCAVQCGRRILPILRRIINFLLPDGRESSVERRRCRTLLFGLQKGLGIGIFPELKLTHLISKERVAEDYLIRLFEGTGISNLLLACKWRGELPWSPLTGRGPLSLLKNLVLRSGITVG